MEKQIGIAVKEIKAIDFKDRTVVVAKTGEKVKILDVFKGTNTVWIQCQGWEFEVCTSLDNIQLQGEILAQITGSKSWPKHVLLPPITDELVPESETGVFERLSGVPITFSRDARGNVTGLTGHYHGKAFSYEKISDQPPDPEPLKPCVAIKLDTKLLDAVVGHYEFAPQ